MASALPETMLEAHISPTTTVSLHTVPLPSLTHPHHILIRVHSAACNPKDWKLPAGILHTISNCPNSGDDIAGTIAAVGSSVRNFRHGDRVAALHQLGHAGGSYAEYALAHDWTAWHIPDSLGFEAASTMPMGVCMAGIGLFAMLRVPSPMWNPHVGEAEERAGAEKPVLIYGAAGAVGAFAVKIARIVGPGPIIGVAGKGGGFVRGLIDEGKGDRVVDYRGGKEELVRGIREAAGGRKIECAFDAVSEKGSFLNCAEVLDQQTGRLTLVLPQRVDGIPEGIEQSNTMAGSLWTEGFDRKGGLGKLGLETGGREFGAALSATVQCWLEDGRLEPHPFEVVEGGLGGLEGALKALREGKVSGKKFVIRIRDTEGLSKTA